MSTPRYWEEFKIEALKHVTERRYTVADVVSRLGPHPQTLQVDQGGHAAG